MKKVLCVLIAAALSATAFAQPSAPAAAAPKKNVISTFRVWVKPGQTQAFKSAIAAHAQKFHQGEHAWRVGEVMSGPDGGAFQINEGPTSWTALDDRGDLGAEHQADFDKNILPLVERMTPDSYATYSEELSGTKVDAWTNKVGMIQYYIRPGRTPLATDVFKRLKAIWEKRGISFAVWSASWSGEPRYSVAFRLKNGWKSFDTDSGSNREIATQLWGAAAYDRLMSDMAQAFERTSSELVNYDPALGTR